MFDIGFQEIVLVALVALFVLGPEKMPEAVRTVALMIGRLKRTFNALKTEIEKEVGADEIRRQLRNEEIMERFKETQNQIQSTVDSVKNTAEEIQKNIELESQVVAGLGSEGAASETAAVAPPSEPATTAADVVSDPLPVTSGNSTTAATQTELPLEAPASADSATSKSAS